MDGTPDPPAGTPPEAAGAARPPTEKALEEIRELLDTHIARNDLQRKAFDTLHEELQQYKKSFILNEFQRPAIRNLIQLYDHMVEMEQHLPAWGPRKTGPTVPEFVDRLGEFIQNFTNLRYELTEVLERLEVETYDERHDALQQERLKTLDRNLHRPVAVEPTTDPTKQNQVTRVHKSGFYWRDKVFRPEEVTILRHDGGPKSQEQKNG